MTLTALLSQASSMNDREQPDGAGTAKDEKEDKDRDVNEGETPDQ